MARPFGKEALVASLTQSIQVCPPGVESVPSIYNQEDPTFDVRAQVAAMVDKIHAVQAAAAAAALRAGTAFNDLPLAWQKAHNEDVLAAERARQGK